MQRLEKTVLRTAADTTPDHRPGDISHRAAIDAYRLAEALHHQLLKVIGQEAEALVVGQYCLAAVAERVAVPQSGQRMPHRQILSPSSEARRVGQECVSKCRFGWSTHH